MRRLPIRKPRTEPGNKVAKAQLLLGRTMDAIRSFDEAADVARQLAAKDPQNQEVQRDLGVSRYQAMSAYRVAGDLAGWRKAADEAAAQFTAVYTAAGGSADAKADLVGVLGEAAAAVTAFSGATPEDLQVALSRAKRAVELSGGVDPSHLETQASLLALTGETAAGVAAFEKAIALPPKSEPSRQPSYDETWKRLEEKLAKCREAARASKDRESREEP